MPGLLERLELRLGQLVAGLGIDLAGLLVDQVLGDVAAEQVLVRPTSTSLMPSSASLRARRGVILVAGLGHHLAGLGVDQVGSAA